MKYYLDTEFIEGIRWPLLRNPRWDIELISIGIVREDGLPFYAVSTEFNPKHANAWVKENVLPLLPPKGHFYWCTKGQMWNRLTDYFPVKYNAKKRKFETTEKIEIYGYYADYDWVLFCSLFGSMMQLPDGFPKYCRDLKQMFDEKVQLLVEKRKLHQPDAMEVISKHIRTSDEYPDQETEHNALEDAKWNLDLHTFIQKYDWR